MNKAPGALRRFSTGVMVVILKGLSLIAFRPRRTFVSPLAKEALKGPCLLVSNHVRGIDGVVIASALPGKRIIGLVAKDMLDNSRLLRLFMRFVPSIPIDREHPSLSWMRESRRELKQGAIIYLCPEGRCNFAKVIRPFKPGFVTLAASAGVKVIPIYHNGEYHYVFGKRFRMIVGEPYTVTPPPEGLGEAEMRREADELRRQMQSLELQLNGFVRTEPVDWEEDV